MNNTGRTASGRFASGNTVAKRRGEDFSETTKAAARAPGHDGIVSYGGFVPSNEPTAKLQGREKWVQFANAYFRPAVAVAALLRWNLLSGMKWSLIPNPAGGRDAERGLEIVEKGLLNADLPEPWQEVVAKAGMSYFEGSSLHAWALGRRKDGLVVFTDISHRPMHTVEKWLRAADDRAFEAVEQRVPNGKTYRVPLNRCLYLVEKIFGDHPEGVGVLRLILERGQRTNKYERVEGSEIFGSMGGMPIADVPIDELNAECEGMSDEERAAHKAKILAPIESILADRIKTPEKQMFATLNSAPYRSEDGNTVSQIRKWNIRILKGELQGLADIRKIINDSDLNDARILNVEFVFVGGNDSSGSYNMHESKLGMFARSVQNTGDRVAVRANQQLIRPLIAANGLDPDTAAPRAVLERLTISDVLRVAEMLGLITKANLHPKDPARNILREREGLPPEPEEIVEEMLAPRGNGEFDDEDEDVEDVEDVEDDDPKPGDVKPKKKEPKA